MRESREGLNMLRMVLYAGVVAVLLFVVACSGGDDGPEPTDPVESETPTEAPSKTTFDDAFAYCAAVGTIDELDERWAGEDVPASLFEALATEFELIDPDFSQHAFLFKWRCFEGQVLGCSVGANLPCGPADTSREPSERVVAHCRDNPDSPLSFAITGRETIYLWECEGTTAVIGPQEPQEVDERGFHALFWREITLPDDPA